MGAGPTTGAAPCDCEIKTTTITPAPVTTTEAGKVTTVTPDPVTSEVTVTTTPAPVTTTEAGKVTTVTPAPVTTTEAGKVTTVTPNPVTSEVTVTTTPAPVVTTVEGPAVTETLPQITVTEVPTTLTTSTLPVDEGKDILGRCVANAVRSPILYMVPLLLAGQVLGEVAAPYVKAVNDQFDRISAEIQDEIRRKTPNFGYGRRGQENEQVAELRAKAEAANRMLQELAMRPDVQQYGQWAAIAAGVVVAGSVLYDWCSNEPGEAFTAIGPKKTATVDDVRVGSSSLGGDRVTTIVPPVTQTSGRDESDGSSEGSSGSSE